MDTNLFERESELQARKPLIILVIISLILTIICNLADFTYYTSHNGGDWKLKFALFVSENVADSIFSIISYLLSVAPILLFAIYIFNYNKFYQSTSFLIVVLGLIAFRPLFNFIINLILWGYNFSFLNILSDMLTIIPFIVATISVIKGIKKNIFLIIAVACSLLVEVLFCVINYGRYITRGLYLYMFSVPLSIVGISAFYAALLLFVLKNNVHVLVKKVKNIDKMSTEQSLLYLKEQFDLGVITEEDYQAQRADIISKL